MLQKHSKDIIFIVIILILIGIIWGVEKNIWILIAINVVVIMVGLLYVNMTDVGYNVKEEKKKPLANNYFTLKTIAEKEMEEFLNEVDYDNFENVKKGKAILDKFSYHDEVGVIAGKIKKVCNYDIEVYYLGLTAITYANVNKLSEQDFAYIALGIRLINSSNKLKTRLTDFLRTTKF